MVTQLAKKRQVGKVVQERGKRLCTPIAERVLPHHHEEALLFSQMYVVGSRLMAVKCTGCHRIVRHEQNSHDKIHGVFQHVKPALVQYSAASDLSGQFAIY